MPSSVRLVTVLTSAMILSAVLLAHQSASTQLSGDKPASPKTCVNPPAGMVSWWPGEGNANDIQGGNNGTVANGATFAIKNAKAAISDGDVRSSWILLGDPAMRLK